MKKRYHSSKLCWVVALVVLCQLVGADPLNAQCLEGSCQDGEGIFVFDNGQRYVGQFSNGRIEGQGALYYPNGNRYLGGFTAGRPHGEGVLIYPDGRRRDGIWSYGELRDADDQPAELTSRGGGQAGCISGDCENGRGTYLSVGGAIYVGEFSNGEIHGQGVCYYPDGSKYQGEWAHRYPEGQGTKTWSSGRSFTGHWQRGQPLDDNGYFLDPIQGNASVPSGFTVQFGCLQGDCDGGRGTFAYADGSRYEGDFRSGQPHGNGTFYYPNGDIHRGEFAQGLPHGSGIRTYSGGRQSGGQWIEGTYRNMTSSRPRSGCLSGNCENGFGTYVFRQGDRYTGSFVDGKPQGSGQVFYQNGDRYEGNMAAGAFSGFGTFTSNDGAIFTGQWREGHFLGQSEATIQPSSPSADLNIWALIIGVSSYRHMPALRFPDDDAYRLFAFLKSPQGGALSDDHIRILIDEDATKDNITAAMEELFSKAGENDLVVLYFSGHGLPGAFLPIDYDGNNNLLYHYEIRELLDASPAGYKLCLADACHSGSLLASRGEQLPSLLSRYYENLANARRGTALVMSSKSEETSLESSGLRQGVFSHFLLRGLKGEADQDQDGVVRLQELYYYVEENVRAYTGNAQSPVIQGDYDQRMPVSVIR